MIRRLLAAAAVAVGVATLVPAVSQAATFSNSTSIALRDPNFTGNANCSNPAVLCNATAATYPSSIAVSGQTGTVSSVSLSLNNVSYSFSDDIDALLVGPGGQSLIVVAAVGPNAGAGEAASNSTLTVSDSGTLPTATTAWGASPTFKPANFGSYGLGNSANGFNENYTSPAPAAPWGDPGQHGTNATLANTFDGTSPNGTWKLYVITTSAGDGTGAIAGGWSLNVTTASAAGTTTALSSSNNPSFTSAPGNSVPLTASVSSSGSPVSAGTVDFTDGGSTISGCGAVAVTGGTATCSTTFATEGAHTIGAQYSGNTDFGPSSGSLTQQVDNHTTVTGSSYCNTGAITLNNPTSSVADASPYPSHVFVSGLSGTLSHLAVTLKGVTYAESQDIDALLVGPGGQTMILAAAAGPNSGGAISNVTLTLDDSAATTLSSSSAWGAANASVTSKPFNYGGVNQTFGSPAPVGPYGNPGPAGGGTDTLGSVFNGSNPNGTWSLYLITTAAGDGTGSVGSGWCAEITTAGTSGTNTTISSNNNPSFTTSPGNSVTFTATVTDATNAGAVNEGTVDFERNGVTIAGCGAVPVDAGGHATCTTSFSSEGTDTIRALYSGSANFGPSNGSLSQQVNSHTTVTGSSYCNTGPITLNNPPSTVADASPYPSHVFVSGLPGGLTHLAVTLNGVTYSHSQDIDALLVGPGGQSLILVAAAGPNSGGALSNVTLTLDDNAATTLSSTAAWGAANASVTSKPVNYGGSNQTFGSPAPAGPYGNPGPFGGGSDTLGSVFDGSSPNGTWSLYVITTAAGDGTGSIAGGWCLNATTPSPPALTKSFSPSPIPLNGSTTLTFTVSNPNAASSLSGIGFSDDLPSGLVVSSPNGLTGSCGGGTITATAGGSSVSLSGATLAAGASCTFSVDVTGTTAGVKTNTTSVVSSNEGGDGTAASASVTVQAGPPSISKSFGATSLPLNGSTSLSYTITNPAANGTSTGIAFTDNLPSGLVVATPNGLTGSCGGGTITAAAGSSTVSLSGATLAGGDSCTFSVNVTGVAAGVQNNSVTVSSTEGGTGNTFTASVTVVAPPSLTKSFADSSIALNRSTTLSFTVSNPNGSSSLSGIGFTDTLPAGLVVATPNNLTGSCGGGTITATAGSSSVSLSGATLAASASCTFSVDVKGTSAGVKSNTTSVVSSNEGGFGAAASASVTVQAGPPSISKSFGAASIPLNGSTSLSFTISNPAANGTSTGIAFTDTLPSGLVVATPNNLTGSCGGGTITATAGSSSVSLSGATLAGGDSCTFSVDVKGVSPGVQNNSVTVSSNEGGTGNTATASVTVKAHPTISTTASAGVTIGGKVSDAATIAAGNAPTGQIVFKLYGPNDASCSGTPAFTSSAVAVTGNGAYQSPQFTPAAVGTYQWVASYSGDSGNDAAATNCSDPSESVAIGQTATGTTLTSSENPSASGDAVTFTATVTGVSPTGTVTFKDGSATLGTGALDSSGKATFTTSSLSVASHTITAVYGGDASNSPSTSAPLTQVVAVKAQGPPQISIVRPGAGAKYRLGQVVRASYSCSDGANGPGIKSCTGPVPNGSPIATGSPGVHQFKVVAVSKDGQSATKSVSYTVKSHHHPPPSNAFTVSHITTEADGTVGFDLKLPGPGKVDVLETAWLSNFATAAQLLLPAPHRFVYSREHIVPSHGGTVHVTVLPNAAGRRLVSHPAYRVTLRLWVSFTPTGGKQRDQGFYGLTLPDTGSLRFTKPPLVNRSP